jgi:hypothetical protein
MIMLALNEYVHVSCVQGCYKKLQLPKGKKKLHSFLGISGNSHFSDISAW